MPGAADITAIATAVAAVAGAVAAVIALIHRTPRSAPPSAGPAPGQLAWSGSQPAPPPPLPRHTDAPADPWYAQRAQLRNEWTSTNPLVPPPPPARLPQRPATGAVWLRTAGRADRVAPTAEVGD